MKGVERCAITSRDLRGQKAEVAPRVAAFRFPYAERQRRGGTASLVWSFFSSRSDATLPCSNLIPNDNAADQGTPQKE